MASSPNESLQRTLGPAFTLERELGGGGMSRVYVAQETAFGRRVVVKVLAEDLAASVSIDRFNREIQFAATLQHPHIVPLLSAGEADGLPYFTMPYVEGESLRARLMRDGELPVAEAVRMLREVATALSYAHGAGVIHRDIKPENVLLSGGIAMVTDFGIAKALVDAQRTPPSGTATPLTAIGTVIGTPAYIAPEQAAGDSQIDQRADIYAWGVMAYEVLTGSPPFAGRSAQATLAAHVSEPPEQILRRRPRVPASLADLVMKSLEKRPADRPQSAAALVQGLDAMTVPHTASRRRAALLTLMAIAAVVLIAIVVPAIRRSTMANHAVAAADTGTRSIAVMPFVGTDRDSSYRYFADGITDELGTALGHVTGLQVISRRSAFAFEGKQATAQDIGRALGASLLLDGTVRRAGNRVRVNAQLTNASDATVLWTDHYEGDAKDVFALQDSIASAIVGALRLAIGVGSGRGSGSIRTANLDAHDLYLEGKFAASTHTRAGLITALDLFRRAAEKDPRYALPLVGTADADGWLADDYMPAAEAYSRATIAANRAVQLAPDLAEAHAVLSWIRYAYDWRMSEAATEASRAIALDAGSALAHSNYSYPLVSLGQNDQALAEIRRAVALEPLSAALSANFEWHLYIQRKFDEAIAQHRHTQQLDSNYFFADSWAAAANRELGHYDEARRLYQEAQGLQGGRPLPGLAITYVRMGDTVQARRILADLLGRSRRAFVKPEGIAQVYTALGVRDSAFLWLDRAYHNRSDELLWLRHNIVYDPIRSDPRFVALVQRIAADTLPSH